MHLKHSSKPGGMAQGLEWPQRLTRRGIFQAAYTLTGYVVAWYRALNKPRNNLLNNLRKLLKSGSQSDLVQSESQNLLFDDHNMASYNDIVREKTPHNSTTGTVEYITEIRDE